MAIVRHLTKVNLEVVGAHSETSASYSVVAGPDGRRYLQLDTYGSEARKLKGKKSQSIRFSPEAIAELKEILAKYF